MPGTLEDFAHILNRRNNKSTPLFLSKSLFITKILWFVDFCKFQLSKHFFIHLEHVFFKNSVWLFFLHFIHFSCFTFDSRLHFDWTFAQILP